MNVTKYILALLGLLVASTLLASNKNENDIMISLFLDSLKKSFGPLNTAQAQSVSQIITSFLIYGDRDWKKLVYILATAYHESKLLLVKEKRGSPGSDLYNLQEKYWNTGYFGRGYVQLTHKENYKKMGELLGLDLLGNPDLALDKRNAADIIVVGMTSGTFTGMGLSRYINPTFADYFNARKVVNGLDRAQLIADYALKIEQNLEYQIA